MIFFPSPPCPLVEVRVRRALSISRGFFPLPPSLPFPPILLIVMSAMSSSAYVETLRTDRTAQVKFMLTAALSLTGFIVFCIEATKSNTSSNSHKYYVTGQNMKERLLPAATVCPTTTDTMVSYATRYWRQLAQILLTTCKMRTHTKQSTPSHINHPHLPLCPHLTPFTTKHVRSNIHPPVPNRIHRVQVLQALDAWPPVPGHGGGGGGA